MSELPLEDLRRGVRERIALSALPVWDLEEQLLTPAAVAARLLPYWDRA